MAAQDDNKCGVLDGSISTALKVWIKQRERMVCGIIGPGTTRSLSAKWDSPLEQANANSKVSSEVGGGIQAVTGTTSVTTFSSTQVWQGNMPLKFSLNLIFIAQSDAKKEVMRPLQWLEEFASCNIKGMSPFDLGAAATNMKAFFSGGTSDKSLFGRIPSTVCVNIGRKIIVPDCVIENISIPLDKERDSAGNLIRAEVQMDIQTMTMLNYSDIAATWSGTDNSINTITSKDWIK